MVEIKCSNCNKIINRSPTRLLMYKTHYCNRECQRNHYKQRFTGKKNPNYKNSNTKICSYCKKKYAHYSKTRKFCSLRCFWLHRKKKFKCVTCQKEFLDSRSKHQGKKGAFCSVDCYFKSCDITLICEKCGTKFTVKKSFRKQRFCSVKCLTKIRKEEGWVKGKNNPRWLGGTSGYRGENWKEQRQKAYNRDKGACQICGCQDKVAIHHIIPWRIKPNNDLKNLITLCRSHHTREENYYRQFKTISSFMLNFILEKANY